MYKHTKQVNQVLFDAEAISKGVKKVAANINKDYGLLESEGITLIPILTGSIIFVADLIRELPLQMRVVPISARSYIGKSTVSSGKPVVSNIPLDLKGRHVILIEDILDSGNTLKAVKEEVEKLSPASIKICVLLRKKREENRSLVCEYVAFEIPDIFVVGYGLDYDGLWRNSPEIYTLKM